MMLRKKNAAGLVSRSSAAWDGLNFARIASGGDLPELAYLEVSSKATGSRPRST